MSEPNRGVMKLLMVGLVLLAVMFAAFMMLSSISSARKAAIRQSMEASGPYVGEWADRSKASAEVVSGNPSALTPLAYVQTYVADIHLIPKTSIGTARPESIYEARFEAKITAAPPKPSGATQPVSGDCQIQLPLPPQIISLADLTFTINDKPSQDVDIQGDRLVWRGPLDVAKPAELRVTYTAVGKGIYTLNPPPGKVIDRFEVNLTAHKTTVSMLELSRMALP